MMPNKESIMNRGVWQRAGEDEDGGEERERRRRRREGMRVSRGRLWEALVSMKPAGMQTAEGSVVQCKVGETPKGQIIQALSAVLSNLGFILSAMARY